MERKKGDLYSKKKETFVQIIIGIFFGGAVCFLFLLYNRNIFDIKTLTENIPLWVKILIFIISYITSVALHELSHFVIFIKNGINMRALYIMFLLFIKDKGKWRFKLRFNALMLTGGVAIPYVPEVKNEKELNDYQKAFANSIIVAPIVTILIPIVFGVIFSLVIDFFPDNTLNGICMFIILALIVINVLLALSCLIKNELAIGDFHAYKMCKEDKYFMAIMLQQYRTIQGEYECNNSYLNIMLNEYIKKEFDEKSINTFTLGVINNDLNISLANRRKTLSNIEYYIKYFEENSEILAKSNLSGAKILLFSVIEYLAIEEGDIYRARVLYGKVKCQLNKEIKNKSIEYHIKQCEHLFGIKDNKEFLLNRNNIRASEEWQIWSIFEEYYKLEGKINDRIFSNRVLN